MEKNYNEMQIFSNKQSIKEVLIQRAVKKTIEILHDKELFDSFPNADKVLKDFLFVQQHKPGLWKKYHVVQ